MADADLEIGLSFDRKSRDFDVSLRFDVPGTSTDEWLHPRETLVLDKNALLELRDDEVAYGAALTEQVMGHTDIRRYLDRARSWIDAHDVSLHLRLHLDAPASWHALRWELLRDPATGIQLVLQDRVLFSRYLSSNIWRPVLNRPERKMRAVVAVAAPTDVARYRNNGVALLPVDAGEELRRAEHALKEYEIITRLGDATPTTLTALLRSLEEDIDVLYLVCHGLLTDDVPQLLLVDEQRRGVRIDGRRLVERFTELDRCPVVVVLNSCQSAGAGAAAADSSTDAGVLAALGPRVAGAGVAAVVAMQGNVTAHSATLFADTFFASLAADGVVDRSMAVARRTLFDNDRQDWWVPALFSRLRSGRTQYRPKFAEREEKAWWNITEMLAHRQLTPVLGPGLGDDVLGSRQDIAQLWVKRWSMPLATHHQADLAQVAQYLRVNMSDAAVRTELLSYYQTQAAERRERATAGSPYDLPDHILRSDQPAASAREIGKRQRASDEGDPYRVMASLQVPVYITTGWTPLLQDALKEKGREPVTMAFPWNSEFGERYPDLAEKPTVEKPLVYHLFGTVDDFWSMVLTEDDYFAWLKAWIIRRAELPGVVREALTSRSLLFIGYRLDDWDFRVVFQSIKAFEGSETLLARHKHSGVQLSPESQSIEPEAAQEYLESYFGNDRFTIYWGKTRPFLDELREKVGLET